MIYQLENPPALTTDHQSQLRLGGFSGLFYDKNSIPTEPEFFTVTDRGPNGEPFKYKEIYTARVFFIPDFQPRIVHLKIKNKTLEVIKQIPLFNPDGSKISGRPNRSDTSDEFPLNIKKEPLEFDLNGLDTESIAIDDKGHFWLGEEYRPSILKFDKNGKLLKRFVPKNSFTKEETNSLQKKYGKSFLVAHLPEIYNQRMLNRGFEAMTIYKNKLYAMTQSSLALNEKKKSESSVIRILELDINTEKITGEYIYLMKNQKIKLGDMAVTKSGELLILEQDGVVGQDGYRSIFKINLQNATNILDLKLSKHPENMTDEEIQKSLKPVGKELLLDLVKEGFNFAEKVEGLTLIDDQTLAVMNDNDFGIENGEVTNNNKTNLEIFGF